jgi:hypothetical protein
MPTQTITISAQDFAELQESVGDMLRLPGNPPQASAAQIKAVQLDYLKGINREYKRRKAIAAIGEPTEIDPS